MTGEGSGFVQNNQKEREMLGETGSSLLEIPGI